jgi:hypothetical protein
MQIDCFSGNIVVSDHCIMSDDRASSRKATKINMKNQLIYHQRFYFRDHLWQMYKR